MDRAIEKIIERIEAIEVRAEEIGHKNKRLLRKLESAIDDLGEAKIEAERLVARDRKARRRKNGK